MDLEYADSLSWETDLLKFDKDVVLLTNKVEYVTDVVPTNVVTGRFKDYSEVYRKEREYVNKMEAYHMLRNKYIFVVDVDRDIEKYNVISPSPNGYLPNHIILNVGEDVESKVNIIDFGFEAGLKTLFLEVNVDEDAKLEVNYLYIHSRDTPMYGEFYFKANEKSEIDFNILGFGGKMTHIRSYMDLLGRESRGYTLGSLIAREKTKTDVITNVTHHGDYSESILSIRGGILENGYLVHRGAARILNVSHESNTAVKSYLTIFGEHGTAHSIPMLEVDTGIVAGASHSTSVSKLDEYRLFYLEKMGLSEREIVDLLLRAYVEYSGVAEEFDIDWRRIIKL